VRHSPTRSPGPSCEQSLFCALKAWRPRYKSERFVAMLITFCRRGVHPRTWASRRFARVPLRANRWRARLASYSPWRDSRTFWQQSRGIRLASSQTVNVVLFSLTCRKVSTSPKYFVLGYLRLRGPHPVGRNVLGCGNLVESSVRSAREVFGRDRHNAAKR